MISRLSSLLKNKAGGQARDASEHAGRIRINVPRMPQSVPLISSFVGWALAHHPRAALRLNTLIMVGKGPTLRGRKNAGNRVDTNLMDLDEAKETQSESRLTNNGRAGNGQAFDR